MSSCANCRSPALTSCLAISTLTRGERKRSSRARARAERRQPSVVRSSCGRRRTWSTISVTLSSISPAHGVASRRRLRTLALRAAPRPYARPAKSGGEQGKDHRADVGPLAADANVLQPARDHEQTDRVEKEERAQQ